MINRKGQYKGCDGKWHKRPTVFYRPEGCLTAGEHDERQRLEFKAICAKYNYCCVSCGKHGPLTRDHVVPSVKHGPSSADNIQPLCLRCNELKHTKTIDYRLTPHMHCLAP